VIYQLIDSERVVRRIAIEQLNGLNELQLFSVIDADNDDRVGNQPSVLASFHSAPAVPLGPR
jgi:hypothetical protein